MLTICLKCELFVFFVFQNNSKPKHDQLNFLTSNVFMPERNTIMCGDMNLDAYDDEQWANDIITNCGVHDVARKNLHDIPDQFTYDCKLNTNAYRYRSQLDRIFYKGALKPVSRNLIGTHVIPEIKIHPSDHFGIICSFDIDIM